MRNVVLQHKQSSRLLSHNYAHFNADLVASPPLYSEILLYANHIIWISNFVKRFVM